MVPFLERLISEFPVAGDPAIAPEPPLEALVAGWTIGVEFDGALAQVYQPGDPDKMIRFELLSGPTI